MGQIYFLALANALNQLNLELGLFINNARHPHLTPKSSLIAPGLRLHRTKPHSLSYPEASDCQ